MTASYEKLYFLSQKLGQSAASIKSFQFAAEANGASAAEATALVEKLIDYRRRYGAGSGNDVIGKWFTIDPNSNTKIKDITESLAKMSQQQASAIGRATGVSDNLLDAIRSGKFGDDFKEEADRIAVINGTMTDRIAKGALQFNNAWRGIQATIGEVAVSIFASVTGEHGPVEAMRAFDKWMIANAPQILKAFSDIATKVIEFSEAFVSVISGVDSADPKIRTIAAAFGSWGVTLDRLVRGLQTVAALLAGGLMLQFFATLAGLFGVGAAAAGGGVIAGIAGLAAAAGAGYLAYSGVGKAMGANGGGDAPAPANAPAPDAPAPAPADSSKVGIDGGQTQKPAYGPGSNVNIAGPAASRADGDFFGSIIKAEGTGKRGDPYNEVLGYGQYGRPPKPLTEMSLKEVYDWGHNVLRPNSGGLNSSAVGAFQIVGQTMKGFMGAAGLGWDDKFSPENQRKLAVAIARGQGIKSSTWAGFASHPREMQLAREAFARGQIGTAGAPAGQADPHKPGFDANAVKFHDYYAAPAGGDASPGFTKPSGLYGSPQIQAMLRKYGMGGDISSKYKSATGFAPITAALTEAGGWASKANSIMEALKLDTRLAVHGLTQDWRDITAYGHNLKEAIKKGLGGPAARERDRLKNQLLSGHAAAKAFDMRASAADHLKTTPMGAGHQHLMNRSSVHAPSQTNNITIHGVTDTETAMRDLGWHQKRLWSGLTRNTTTTAN